MGARGSDRTTLLVVSQDLSSVVLLLGAKTGLAVRRDVVGVGRTRRRHGAQEKGTKNRGQAVHDLTSTPPIIQRPADHTRTESTAIRGRAEALATALPVES